jgi:hypothetical protein
MLSVASAYAYHTVALFRLWTVIDTVVPNSVTCKHTQMQDTVEDN